MSNEIKFPSLYFVVAVLIEFKSDFRTRSKDWNRSPGFRQAVLSAL
jgi:hypothetical protein